MSLSVSGRPPVSVQTDNATRSRLATLLPNLQASLANASLAPPTPTGILSANDLQVLLYSIQLYQHEVLGPDAKTRPANPDSTNPLARHPPRIPAHCFRTTASLTTEEAPSADSAVFNLLDAALQSLARRGDKSVDIAVDEVAYTELVAAVRERLREKGFLRRFTVAARGDFSEAEKDSLRRMAESLECEWANDAAQATHVLHPSTTPPVSPSGTTSPDYHRTLARSANGKQSLVHVWYRPDSHDTWLPSGAFADPEPEPEQKDRWDLESRWLRDGVRYNELMNEEDYELNAEEESGSAAAPSSSVVTSIANSKKRELPEEIIDESSEDGASGASTKKIKLLVAAKPTGAVPIDLAGASSSIPGKIYEKEPLPGGVIGNLPPEPAASADVSMSNEPGVEDDGEILEKDESDNVPSAVAVSAQHRKAAALAKRYLASQTQEIIIPSYSTWFSFNTISPLERRSLPEFFNGRNRSKTPEIYKEYRDFMINTYRLNPSEYLTFTACRRNLAGDVCSIMRVHGFLEQWGLVNYQIDPETRPAALGPPFTGHFRVLVDAPRGLQPLHPGTRRPTQPGHAALTAENGVGSSNGSGAAASRGPSTVDLSLELRRTVYSTTLRASRPISGSEAKALSDQADAARASGAGAGPSYSCDTCGSDCTRSRYHSIKSKDYAVCPGCYHEGRFPSSMFSGDFVRVDDAAFKQGGGSANIDGIITPEWSDAETLRLLEALEMFGDEWSKVEEHVGTRNVEECIAKFVQLPIEEPYLGGGSGSSNGVANGKPTQSDLGPLQYLRDPKSLDGSAVPFAQSDNPVMSVVAFLASAVSPAVASAAAQSALGELTEGLRKRVAKGKDGVEVAGSAGDAPAAAAAPDADGMDVDKSSTSEADRAVAEATDIEVTVTDAAKSELAQARENAEDAGAQSQPTTRPSAVPRNAVERAAAIALGAAASKAYVLSSFEERECQRLVKQVIEAQMRKMEIKMSQFEELESLLETERRQLEVGRKELYAERLKVQRQLRAVNELVSKAQAQAQAHSQAYARAQAQAAEGGAMPPPPAPESLPQVTRSDVVNVASSGASEGQGPTVREVPAEATSNGPPSGGTIAQL
ncbi:unnamed protein product [Parajaminaea phylloscopi]